MGFRTAVVYIALGACLLIAGIAYGAGSPERVCFPASQWDAPSGQRPCYTVARLFEDGSGHLVVGTARKAQAVCIVPNVAEERGRFTIRCRRVPSR